MTYKIWIDENGVPKWHPNFLSAPPEKGDPDFSWKAELYLKSLSEADEFEDKEKALMLCWENDREIHNPLSFGHWKVELKSKMINRFYDIELDGRIEIHNGKARIIHQVTGYGDLEPHPAERVAVESEDNLWIEAMWPGGVLPSQKYIAELKSKFEIKRR